MKSSRESTERPECVTNSRTQQLFIVLKILRQHINSNAEKKVPGCDAVRRAQEKHRTKTVHTVQCSFKDCDGDEFTRLGLKRLLCRRLSEATWGHHGLRTVFETWLQGFLHELDRRIPLRFVRDGTVLQSIVLDHPLSHTQSKGKIILTSSTKHAVSARYAKVKWENTNSRFFWDKSFRHRSEAGFN